MVVLDKVTIPYCMYKFCRAEHRTICFTKLSCLGVSLHYAHDYSTVWGQGRASSGMHNPPRSRASPALAHRTIGIASLPGSSCSV